MLWLDEITYGRPPPIRSQHIRRTDDHVTSMSQLKLMTSSINCSSHYDMKSSKRTFKTKPNRSYTMNLIGLWSDQSEACIACQCKNVQKANILCEMSFFAEATYLLVLFQCSQDRKKCSVRVKFWNFVEILFSTSKIGHRPKF